MSIAALYDIHGNLPALEAVLDELAEVQPDILVLGGDIVSGPMPAQTLTRLRALDTRILAIRGNADREAVTAWDGQPFMQRQSAEVRAITSWVAQQLSREQRDFLAGLPTHLTLAVEGLGDVLFCHATPHSDEMIFTPRTPQQRLHTLFQGIEQPVVVCGHTHMQFEIQVGDVRVLNAGSVGMPYAERPGAYWLLLDAGRSTFRRTAYDLQAAARAVRTSGYPQASQFAEENLLTIPSAQAAMEVFSRMAETGA
ncbi:MAG TPA: metallophosphoesterase family protein [Ktedonobacteraceae bacterium]|jgi:putative phosphoesterase